MNRQTQYEISKLIIIETNIYKTIICIYQIFLHRYLYICITFKGPYLETSKHFI